MKRAIIIIIFLLVVVFRGFTQINKYGYNFYSNYLPKDYNSESQNWDVINDKNGIIYVANNSGMLQFDGVSWKRISINSDIDIRTLGINKEGVIYLGGNSVLGYLRPNLQGNLVFNTLMNKLNAKQKEFSYIYKINVIEDTVYFSTDNQILFKYIEPEDTIFEIKLPEYTLFTYNVNNKLYGGSYSEGLFKIVNDTPEQVKGGDFYTLKNIFSLQSGISDSCFYVITGNSGIFKYNTKLGVSQNILKKNSQQIAKNSTFYASFLHDKVFYNSTIGAGVVSINKDGELLNIFDQEIGIEDHLSSNVKVFSNPAVLWTTLNIGFSSVEISNPFRYFSKESNLDGAVNDILYFGNKLYVGTDIGLYYMQINADNRPYFKKVEGLDEMIWSIVKSPGSENNKFIVGTNNGIFEVDYTNHSIKSIEDNLLNIEDLFEVTRKDAKYRLTENKLLYSEITEVLWVGSKSRIIGLKRIKNKWNVEDLIFNTGDKVVTLCEDSIGNIWGSTSQNGLVYLKKDKIQNKFLMHTYDTANGLPVNYGLRMLNYNNNVLALTSLGIYKYNSNDDRFYVDTTFPEKFYNGTSQIKRFYKLSDNSVVINFVNNGKYSVERLFFGKDSTKIESKPFKRIKQFNSECIYEMDDHLWFGVSNTLYSYDLKFKRDFSDTFNCLVRKVEGNDSTYFKGTYVKESSIGFLPSNIQSEKQKPILKYADNNLIFHFAAPFFEGVEEIEFSYRLDGYKDDWSKWNKEPKAVFTNLNNGQYTFKVKAKNIYEIESTIGEYSFTVLPPWYKTILAYILYVVFGLFLVWLIVKFYTRRLEQEKIQLEGIVRERTAEIREQRDEIAEQKQSIEDSIIYARRIQRAILPSEELAEDILPEHFILFRPRDVVSGDYFWMNKIGNKVVLVAADCTGHGVPGAFMSMLGVSFLNEIVLKENTIEPHLILNKLRNRVKKTLKQEGKEGEAKDGMDVALVVLDETERKIYFSGAYNPVLIYRGEELHEIKADRMPIGIYVKEKESFTLNVYDYEPGDTFYIFSDGYPDQFGGPKGQKFRIKVMKQLLASLQPKSMAEQKEILNTTIENWMAETPGQDQIDDMVVIGVRL